HIGSVEDRRRALARLIEQRERSGGRRIGELAARRVDAVLADRIARQQRKNARAALLPLGAALLALLALLLAIRPVAAAASRTVLGNRGASHGGPHERNDGTTQIDHVRFPKNLPQRPTPSLELDGALDLHRQR